MSSNTEAKKRTIARYGNKCFIEALGLRTEKEVAADIRRFKSKKQRAILDELTYHHIIEKCKGGKATVENGAILRNINHIWFNRLSKEKQAEINKLFQEYKAQLDKERTVLIATTISSEKIEKPIKIDLDIDNVEDCIIIPVYDYTEKEYLEHKQNRNKRIFRKFESLER